ncbi:MAG: hypothetical protein IKG42_00180 [Clostridia bacterium]|nr:hypothetical protein [Clostridia bacterium]
MPSKDCPDEMMNLKTREDLQEAIEKYKTSVIYYVYLRNKVAEYLSFINMSGKDWTFGQYVMECIKVYKSNEVNHGPLI